MVARRRWTAELVIESILDRHQKKLALNPQSLETEDSALLAAGRRYFGSWPKALKEAGISMAFVHAQRHPRGHWSQEKVLMEIRKHHQLGLPLNARAIQQLNNRLISAATYYFGSWRQALIHSGFDPDTIQRNKRHTEETIRSEIAELLHRSSDVRDITMRRHHRRLYWAASQYFGSWQKALHAVQYDGDSEWGEDSRNASAQNV